MARRVKMQKRNCRMTVNEAKAHDQAVKLRKMTDVQLLKFMEDEIGRAHV